MITINQKQDIDKFSAELNQLFTQEVHIEMSNEASVSDILVAICRAMNIDGYTVTLETLRNFINNKLEEGYNPEDRIM